MTATQDYLAEFPRLTATKEDPIPAALWPDLSGVIQATVDEFPGDAAGWHRLWDLALAGDLPVAVDLETSGLRPFHESRVAGIAVAAFDLQAKVTYAGYWNYGHIGHPRHRLCTTHKEEPHKKCANCLKWCEGHVETAFVLPKQAVIDRLSEALLKLWFINQNLKFDAKFLAAEFGLPVPARPLCTMLTAHLWDENRKGYNLDSLAKEMGELKLGDDVKKYMEEHGLDVSKHGHAQVAYDVERPYAIRDTVLALKRMEWERQRWLKEADPRLMEAFQAENASTQTFAQMEVNGLKLDLDFIHRGAATLRTEVAELEAQIYAEAAKTSDKIRVKVKAADSALQDRIFDEADKALMDAWLWLSGEPDSADALDAFRHAGLHRSLLGERGKAALVDQPKYPNGRFDILSGDQLWEILESRGLKPLKNTPDGHVSLAEPELAVYTEQGDTLAPLVKAYRGRHKMLGTYFEAFLGHADRDGFMHADFFIHGTVSGRASCREPNLQNITRFEKFGVGTQKGTVARAIQQGLQTIEIKDESTIEVRRCFIPRSPEHSLFFYDYAQMELRVFAEYADEEFLLKTLDEGGDVHEATAREVFPNFPDKEKNKKLFEYFRQMAKQINFGIIYGMGRNKLALQLNVPVDECVRALEMAAAAWAEHPEAAKGSVAADLTPEKIKTMLYDHLMMTNARSWDGLRKMGKEVAQKVDMGYLEPIVCKDGQHQRLMYSAERFLKSYHARFPKIKKFTKAIEDAVSSRGYVFNLFGRRYHMTRDKAYVGVNRLVQGSCADMVKVAQWRVNRLLAGTKSFMINQVHDELQIDLHHTELYLVPKIKECMEHFPRMRVKPLVDIDYSHIAWSEKREWHDEAEFKQALIELRGAKAN